MGPECCSSMAMPQQESCGGYQLSGHREVQVLPGLLSQGRGPCRLWCVTQVAGFLPSFLLSPYTLAAEHLSTPAMHLHRAHCLTPWGRHRSRLCGHRGGQLLVPKEAPPMLGRWELTQGSEAERTSQDLGIRSGSWSLGSCRSSRWCGGIGGHRPGPISAGGGPCLCL